MLSLLWRTIDKIAVYVPRAARKRQNHRAEVADKPALRNAAWGCGICYPQPLFGIA
jgi:hypothetical protein